MNRLFGMVMTLVCAGALGLVQPVFANYGPSFSERVLAAHNGERRLLGLRPLAWSDSLAQEAAGWARILAREGELRHATQHQRRSHGENLWMGSAGAYSVEVMIGAFLDERRHFRPGRFPDISRTGNWGDASHYTQIIWPRTSHVGCAVATAGGMDYLVCRYDPGGNWIGEFVG